MQVCQAAQGEFAFELTMAVAASETIMRRRHFLTFAIGAFLSGSPQAQQAGGLRRVGVLFPGVFGEEREKRLNEGLASELGTERVTVIIKSAAGDSQSLFKYARELVDSRVDVIVAIASGSLEAARRATQTIPIVALDLESDPIAIGAAQSLNRPGGNVTGVFFDAPEIASKWIQIIRELVPQISHAGLLYDLHLDQTQVKAGEISAQKVGIATTLFGIDQPGDFRSAFQRAVDAKVDAILVHSSPIFVDKAAAIAEFAREFRLPSIGLFPIYAKVGGLISYGPNNFDLMKQAGDMVGKVLRGQKAAELPIQRPIYVRFLINLRTAKYLNLTVPASLSALADEVIE
jgi:putative tryptophan/tyrosine transport system substrate-binding protein